jgi:SAM-dependent methyltransferase
MRRRDAAKCGAGEHLATGTGRPGEHTPWASRQHDYWSTIAGDYDELYTSKWYKFEESATATQLGRLLSMAPHEASVLDLGCGTGLGQHLLTTSLGDTKVKYVGVDISSTMLRHARTRSPEGIYICQDAMQLMRDTDYRFDAVISIFTSASFIDENPARLLEAVVHILNPGGYLYLSFLNRYSIKGARQYATHRRIRYATRGSTNARTTLATRTSPGELRRLARQHALDTVRIQSLGPLVGVTQHESLYPVNRTLAWLPIGHTLALSGRKAR